MRRRSVFFCREGRRKWQKWQKRQEKQSNSLESLSFFLATQSGKRWQGIAVRLALFAEKTQ